MNQIINMFLRILMRKAMSKGIDKGIGMMSGGGKNQQMTKAERQQVRRERQERKLR
ncbi:MAG: hypothetical protein GY952_13260 [Rhodobacteraceae bacterium]|nr:hypothetical protein [Paracoccaceae bacterium]